MDFGGEASGRSDRSGRAYGRAEAQPDDGLVRCGPGTPGGELLRRYWQPLARSEEATKYPRMVRIFGEDLVLFRDGSGRPGLLYPRCMHRGTSLLYGRVDESGIRCCYHGWLFDPQGNVLEMACEPGAQPPPGARQPWYPLVEKYGLIFTYMGPPDKEPAFPRFSLCEDVGEDEFISAAGSLEKVTFPGPAAAIAEAIIGDQDYNWFQFHDNVLDPFHLYWLHGALNGIQFVHLRHPAQGYLRIHPDRGALDPAPRPRRRAHPPAHGPGDRAQYEHHHAAERRPRLRRDRLDHRHRRHPLPHLHHLAQPQGLRPGQDVR